MKIRKPIRVIYVSTYIPQKCGIATFTKDVTNAINMINPKALAEIMVVVKKNEDLEFPWEVKHKIEFENRQSYLEAANYVNHSSCDVVLVEHEFGIFGGDCGSYLLDFLKAVKKPKVMTCHTLLEDSESDCGKIFRELAKKCSETHQPYPYSKVAAERKAWEMAEQQNSVNNINHKNTMRK